MPRRQRMFVPGIPVHVVQRGNNRQVTFFNDKDYQFYLDTLLTGLKRYGVDLHAYVLMTNHVHFLMTPQRQDSIPRLFQHIGRLYVRHINQTYKRTGTLWEGRYKCSLVDADEYLLTCHRYIELNPVKAHMVRLPEDYRWSSYGGNALGRSDFLLTSHKVYKGLRDDKQSRCACYRELFMGYIAEEDIEGIRRCLKYNYPLGNDAFKDEVERYLNRAIGQLEDGRPPRLPHKNREK